MSARIDHAAEARRALEEGRESAAKAKTAAQAGYAAEADAHGKKAHGCWMQAQAEATLALVEQQRIANLLAYSEFDDLNGFNAVFKRNLYRARIREGLEL